MTGWRGGSLLVERRTRDPKTRSWNPCPVRSTRKKNWKFFRVKNVVLTRSWCAQPRAYTHAYEWLRTHVKDPVGHVRVRWITKTRKDPAWLGSAALVTAVLLTQVRRPEFPERDNKVYTIFKKKSNSHYSRRHWLSDIYTSTAWRRTDRLYTPVTWVRGPTNTCPRDPDLRHGAAPRRDQASDELSSCLRHRQKTSAPGSWRRLWLPTGVDRNPLVTQLKICSRTQ